MALISDEYIAGTWVMDPQESAVKFSISHLIFLKVPGVFTEFDGQIVTSPDVTESSVQASVQVSSMDTHNARRDEGTLAKDPFDAENHPAITYASTAITPSDEGVRVDGTLTIRGVTRPVVLAVNQIRFVRDANGCRDVRFRATGQVNRQDFGVRFGVPLDRQGVLAGNRVDIELDVSARLLDNPDDDVVSDKPEAIDMGDVNFDESPFVVVVTAEADRRHAESGWTGIVTSVEATARPRPGYGGAIWLAQGRVLGPPTTPDTEHLMGLLFWRSSGDAETFAAELIRAQHDGEFVDDLVVDDGIYQYSATVTAKPDDVTQVDPSRTGSELAHEIIRMTPVSGKQGWIGEYNESETRVHIKHLEGFVLTSFFRDLRSDRIVEYVRWRSAADLTAAFDDARFAEHMSVNSHYSEGEALLFAITLHGKA